MKVYLAGKISKNGWRTTIFKGLRNAQAFESVSERNQSLEEVDGCTYIGPFFIADDHGTFHGKGTHGVGAGKQEDQVFSYSEHIARKQHVVKNCFKWLDVADHLFVWLDSPDAYGTIVEIGYAKAKKIPIFVAVDEKLKRSAFEKDVWFALECADHVIKARDAKQAWDSFIAYGTKKVLKKNQPSGKQIDFIQSLLLQNKKVLTVPLTSLLKEEGGLLISRLREGPSHEDYQDIDAFTRDMTEEEMVVSRVSDHPYLATDVLEKLEERGVIMSMTDHTHAVEEYDAASEPDFTKKGKAGLGKFTYSEAWIDFLCISHQESENNHHFKGLFGK